MPGAIDSRGVYIYAESDAASPVSDLLNLGQVATSNAVAALSTTINANATAASNADDALDTRLDALESDTAGSP